MNGSFCYGPIPLAAPPFVAINPTAHPEIEHTIGGTISPAAYAYTRPGPELEIDGAMVRLIDLREVGRVILHEVKPGWTITKEWEGYTIQTDVAFREINPDEYLGIFYSGGRAPEYIRYDEDLKRTVRWLCELGRPVASVCHGIEILATAGVIRGKKVTTVKKCRFDAEVVGATFVDEPVVVDGNIICARTWHDNHLWMREFMRQLDAQIPQ